MESSGTSFSAAFRAVAPFQEYLLQGSIMDAHCEVLLHRLRGLCDNADTTPETFNDYEAVYQLSKSEILKNGSHKQYARFYSRACGGIGISTCCMSFLNLSKIKLHVRSEL